MVSISDTSINSVQALDLQAGATHPSKAGCLDDIEGSPLQRMIDYTQRGHKLRFFEKGESAICTLRA
jgi:hypothetical protein